MFTFQKHWDLRVAGRVHTYRPLLQPSRYDQTPTSSQMGVVEGRHVHIASHIPRPEWVRLNFPIFSKLYCKDKTGLRTHCSILVHYQRQLPNLLLRTGTVAEHALFTLPPHLLLHMHQCYGYLWNKSLTLTFTLFDFTLIPRRI